jgi:cytochrome c
MKRFSALRVALVLHATAGGFGCGPSLAGDAVRGRAIYQACMDCHDLDKNDVGPKHRGVFGRRSGAAPDYDYSDPLKNSGLVWDEATLDRWLTDPQAVVPGTRMYFQLPSAKDRADVIAFLREVAK